MEVNPALFGFHSENQARKMLHVTLSAEVFALNP
jgi:hypothetical protein